MASSGTIPFPPKTYYAKLLAKIEPDSEMEAQPVEALAVIEAVRIGPLHSGVQVHLRAPQSGRFRLDPVQQGRRRKWKPSRSKRSRS